MDLHRHVTGRPNCAEVVCVPLFGEVIPCFGEDALSVVLCAEGIELYCLFDRDDEHDLMGGLGRRGCRV